MIEPAVVLLRLLQYVGAMILFGSSLFFLYALPASGEGSSADIPWARRLLAAGGALLALSSLLWIAAQASLLAGSVAEGLKPHTLLAVVTGFDLGKVAVVRAAAAALAALLALVIVSPLVAWKATAVLGAIATAGLAWLGHGAAGEGFSGCLHLVSDVLHSWAAAAWIGALVAFWLLLCTRSPTAGAVAVLYRALHGFAGFGTALVAVLVVTGALNGWFLVGPDRLSGLWTTPYGRLLSLKLMLFVVMLGLAAANRFRLTRRLGRGLGSGAAEATALADLRRSLAIETGVGMAVLALVAWFGTLAPPSAM